MQPDVCVALLLGGYYYVSGSDSGSTVTAHAEPMAPALVTACGRMCAREFAANATLAVLHAYDARDGSGGSPWMSGWSSERRIWDPVSCRESLYTTY